MAEHYAALEADFQREYGLHLGRLLWVDGVTPRRMSALVMGISVGSSLHRELDPDGWNWTNAEEMLATIAELVDNGNRISIAKAVKSKSDIPKPIVIPRPWKKDAARGGKGTTMAEFAAMVVADKKERASGG